MNNNDIYFPRTQQQRPWSRNQLYWHPLPLHLRIRTFSPHFVPLPQHYYYNHSKTGQRLSWRTPTWESNDSWIKVDKNKHSEQSNSPDSMKSSEKPTVVIEAQNTKSLTTNVEDLEVEKNETLPQHYSYTHSETGQKLSWRTPSWEMNDSWIKDKNMPPQRSDSPGSKKSSEQPTVFTEAQSTENLDTNVENLEIENNEKIENSASENLNEQHDTSEHSEIMDNEKSSTPNSEDSNIPTTSTEEESNPLNSNPKIPQIENPMSEHIPQLENPILEPTTAPLNPTHKRPLDQLFTTKKVVPKKKRTNNSVIWGSLEEDALVSPTTTEPSSTITVSSPAITMSSSTTTTFSPTTTNSQSIPEKISPEIENGQNVQNLKSDEELQFQSKKDSKINKLIEELESRNIASKKKFEIEKSTYEDKIRRLNTLIEDHVNHEIEQNQRLYAMKNLETDLDYANQQLKRVTSDKDSLELQNNKLIESLNDKEVQLGEMAKRLGEFEKNLQLNNEMKNFEAEMADLLTDGTPTEETSSCTRVKSYQELENDLKTFQLKLLAEKKKQVSINFIKVEKEQVEKKLDEKQIKYNKLVLENIEILSKLKENKSKRDSLKKDLKAMEVDLKATRDNFKLKIRELECEVRDKDEVNEKMHTKLTNNEKQLNSLIEELSQAKNDNESLYARINQLDDEKEALLKKFEVEKEALEKEVAEKSEFYKKKLQEFSLIIDLYGKEILEKAKLEESVQTLQDDIKKLEAEKKLLKENQASSSTSIDISSAELEWKEKYEILKTKYYDGGKKYNSLKLKLQTAETNKAESDRMVKHFKCMLEDENKNSAYYKELYEKTFEEMKLKEEENQISENAMTIELNQRKSRIEYQMEEMKKIRENLERVERIKKDLEEEITNLKEAHEIELEIIKEKHQFDLKMIKDQFYMDGQEIANMKKQYENKLEIVEEKFEKELEEKESQIEKYYFTIESLLELKNTSDILLSNCCNKNFNVQESERIFNLAIDEFVKKISDGKKNYKLQNEIRRDQSLQLSPSIQNLTSVVDQPSTTSVDNPSKKTTRK